MVKKCIYCNRDLEITGVIDICSPCGNAVWGEKMFGAIVNNMENAKERGDLNQGSVTDITNEKPF